MDQSEEAPAAVLVDSENGTSKGTDVTDDFVDGNGARHSGRRSKARMPVDRYAAVYNMQHPKRGLALIFNHENYEVSKQDIEPRTGTNVDCENLLASLQYLHFDVRVYKDLKLRAIQKKLDKVSKMDHSDNDCICITIMTHGGPDSLYASDCQYNPDVVWSFFTGDRCSTLAGKPKIFFVQACRGTKLDAGIRLEKRTETDSVFSMSYKIPTHADFLIAYSTIPGFYSWRNPQRGSWFIQALCQELNQHGKSYDLLTLLTFVAQRVAYDFESCMPDDLPDMRMMHQKKQIPCTSSMLTRLLYFPEK